MNLAAHITRLSALPDATRIDAAAELLARMDGSTFDASAAAALFDALRAVRSSSGGSLARALDGLPTSATAVYLRARDLTAAGDAPGAAACWREFFSLTPCRDAVTHLYAARAFAAVEDWAAAATQIRDALSARPDYTFYARAQGFVREVAQHAPADLRQVRIAVLGSATTSLLVPVLSALGFRDRLGVECYEGLYGAYRQEVLDPGSGLYRFAPQVVFIIPNWRELNLESLAANDDAVEATIAEHANLWSALTSRLPCHVVQHAYDYPATESAGGLSGRSRTGRRRLIRQINLRLADAAPPSVSILDTERIVAEVGLHTWHDAALWHKARQFPSLRAIPALVEEQLAHVRAALGLSRKVVICDLDNTLWGGVVGEDGPAGIRVGGSSPEGEAYAELQRYLKDLRARGILLAVASKNNPDDARQPFTETPGMVLGLDDFAAFEASWDDKVTSIRRIAETLSLGTDAFVVLDDNPLERAWIRSQLPEVAIVELGESPATYLRELDAGRYFEALEVSAEDRQRSDMYRIAAQQAEVRKQAASLEEFLAGLHMQARVQPISDANIARVTQLINKTNQFNLTGRRYTEPEVRQLMSGASWTGVFDLSDRFGSHGIVGVLICRQTAAARWEIDTWLMSCRVLGRQLEHLMLDCAIGAARTSGVSSLDGLYRCLPRNQQVADLYNTLGFALVERSEGESRYRLDLSSVREPYSKYIEVVPSPELADAVGASGRP